jgi:glutathione S-transferase
MPKSSKTALAMGLTLYGHPGTRSPLCNWAANELGIPLEAGDLSKNPHPFNQIPCLTDDNDVAVFESGAILTYFIQNYAASSLSQADKAAITSWIVWANASFDKVCFLETPDGKVYDTGLRKPNKRMTRLNDILSNQDVLVPSAGFSLADVAVASYLLYVLQFFPDLDMSPWSAVKEYMKRCASRQAYADAFGPAVQSRLVSALSSSPPKKLFGML